MLSLGNFVIIIGVVRLNWNGAFRYSFYEDLMAIARIESYEKFILLLHDRLNFRSTVILVLKELKLTTVSIYISISDFKFNQIPKLSNILG